MQALVRTTEVARAVGDAVVGAPLFATAPLIRRWHLRWGATDAEVAEPMASKVNETTAFTIESLEPNRSMLWVKPQSTWAWRLEPLDGGCTRLVVRLRDHYDWRSPGSALLSVLLLEVADFPMMRKLLQGVKERAERRNGLM